MKHGYRSAFLMLGLAAACTFPARAGEQVGPAWVNGVSINELSTSNYYTGALTVKDASSADEAVKPTLVPSKYAKKSGSTSSANAGDAAAAAGTGAESSASVQKQEAETASDAAASSQKSTASAVQTASSALTSALSARDGEMPIGDTVTEESEQYTKGESLGVFRITGYYGGGQTYSGAPTQADHTIAADTAVLPIGTKVFINNTVYTVEDIGGAVQGNMIDIFYDSYEEAAAVTALGERFAEVYAAVPKN